MSSLLFVPIACQNSSDPDVSNNETEDLVPRDGPSVGDGDDSCFAAGTTVSTPAGERLIETLRPGDVVWSYDAERVRLTPARVTHNVVTFDQPVGVFARHDGPTLIGTHNHPFFLPDSGDYQPIGTMPPDSRLLTLKSAQALSVPETTSSVFLSYVPLEKRRAVYNLTVEGFHNYFAGGVLVHNKTVERPSCPMFPWTNSELQSCSGGSVQVEGFGFILDGSSEAGMGGASDDGASLGAAGSSSSGVTSTSLSGFMEPLNFDCSNELWFEEGSLEYDEPPAPYVFEIWVGSSPCAKEERLLQLVGEGVLSDQRRFALIERASTALSSSQHDGPLYWTAELTSTEEMVFFFQDRHCAVCVR